jgi:hypothetical protein
MTINYRTKIVTVTPYTILSNDEVVMINVNGPAVVILPATSGCDEDERVLYIKDFSGLAKTNPITIISAGGKTIDGVSFAILNGGYSHIQLIYDGTNWKTIA